MNQENSKKFYEAYKWFVQLFQDIYAIITAISSYYGITKPTAHYKTWEKGGPLLPDPYYSAFKLEEKSEWKVCLVSVLYPDKASEFKNRNLKDLIKEPALLVIASRRENSKAKKGEKLYSDAKYIIKGANIKTFEKKEGNSFRGDFADNGNFKGFVVPLYAFRKQALEQRSKEKNTTLERALDDTIKELIVKPLEDFLDEKSNP